MIISQESAHNSASTWILDSIHIDSSPTTHALILSSTTANLESSLQFHCGLRPRLIFRGGFVLREVVPKDVAPSGERFGSPATVRTSGLGPVTDRCLEEPLRAVSMVSETDSHAREFRKYLLPNVIFQKIRMIRMASRKMKEAHQ